MKRLRAEFEGLHLTQRAHNIAGGFVAVFGCAIILFTMNVFRVLP